MGGLSQFEDHAGERTAQQRHTKPPSSSVDAPNPPPDRSSSLCTVVAQSLETPAHPFPSSQRLLWQPPTRFLPPTRSALSIFMSHCWARAAPVHSLGSPGATTAGGCPEAPLSSAPLCPLSAADGARDLKRPPPPSPPSLKYPNETLGAEEVSPRTAHHSHSGARPSRCDLSSFDHRRKPEVILLNH